MQKLVLSAVLMLVVSGCSDFNKSSKKSDGGSITPQSEVQAGDNPFPAGVTPKPNEGEFSREKMLLNLGLNVIVPWTRDLERETTRLESFLQDACEDSAQPLDEASMAAARESLKKAAQSWAHLQAVNFGPSQGAGAIISDNINAWPWTNRCGVDKMVAQYSNTKVDPVQIIHTQKGLEVIEYLLFAGDDVVACNPTLPINLSVGNWLKKEVSVRRMDRCHVAMVLSKDLKERAVSLARQWNPARGNYTKTLAQDKNVYPDLQTAINALSDSLFFLEQLKDRKLAIPLGLSTKCEKATCPEMAESPYAEQGLNLALANLKALQALFHGQKLIGETEVGTAFGFDDLLTIEKGRGDLAQRMARELAAAIKTAEGLAAQGGFVQQINAIPTTGCGSLCTLHTQVRDIGRSFKSDFLAVLELRPPRVIEGDND